MVDWAVGSSKSCKHCLTSFFPEPSVHLKAEAGHAIFSWIFNHFLLIDIFEQKNATSWKVTRRRRRHLAWSLTLAREPRRPAACTRGSSTPTGRPYRARTRASTATVWWARWRAPCKTVPCRSTTWPTALQCPGRRASAVLTNMSAVRIDPCYTIAIFSSLYRTRALRYTIMLGLNNNIFLQSWWSAVCLNHKSDISRFNWPR